MKEIQELERILLRLDELRREVDISIIKRTFFALCLYEVVVYHAKGICLLLSNGIYPPAAALLRPLFEGYLRAEWILKSATDSEIEKFAGDKFEKTIKELIKAVDNTIDTTGNTALFGAIYGRLKTQLHGFTHGGVVQASRMFDGKDVGLNYSEDDKLIIVYMAGLMALLANANINAIQGIENSESVGSEIEQMIDTINSWIS